MTERIEEAKEEKRGVITVEEPSYFELKDAAYNLISESCAFLQGLMEDEEFESILFGPFIRELVHQARSIDCVSGDSFEFVENHYLKNEGAPCIHPDCDGTMRLSQTALQCNECCRIISDDLYKIMDRQRGK